jgi:hypothetical protein
MRCPANTPAQTTPATISTAISSRPPLQSLKIPKYQSSPATAGPSAVTNKTVSTDTDHHTPKPESSEKDAVPQASSLYPVMSSLNYDPIWGGYYDPNGVNRAAYPSSNHYPDDGAPMRPYSPSQPVPYVTPMHPPSRPPAGAIGPRPPPMGSYAMPYPYYIPPPYPSTSYHPYGTYKS